MSDSPFEFPSDQSGSDEGQMELFVELYTKHYSRLKYFIMALVPTSDDAKDVLQETSLVLWRKFSSFEPGTNFSAWACQIARFQAMKHYQQNRKSPRLFSEDVMDALAQGARESSEPPEAAMEALEDCVSRLSERDQLLIRRRYEPKSSVEKIADDIGRSANSVSKSLGRIRRALLRCMEKKLSQAWSGA